jgi:flavin reductase (DIM6/NTAB) family NADH-FMN oxidoreductase RutF
MRKDFGAKSWLYPMPVLIVAAYDEHGVPNAMNAAWGGMFTDETVGLCLSAGHKTTKNILATRAFTVSMATVETIEACDYVGIVSGNRVADKFTRAGFHATRSPHVNAPLIDELPMTLECELLAFDPESCHLTGRIVNISADERILTDGQIDPALLHPRHLRPRPPRIPRAGRPAGQSLRLRQTARRGEKVTRRGTIPRKIDKFAA